VWGFESLRGHHGNQEKPVDSSTGFSVYRLAGYAANSLARFGAARPRRCRCGARHKATGRRGHAPRKM